VQSVYKNQCHCVGAVSVQEPVSLCWCSQCTRTSVTVFVQSVYKNQCHCVGAVSVQEPTRHAVQMLRSV